MNDATSAKLLAMQERFDKRLDDITDSLSQIAHQVSVLTNHFLKSDDGNKGEEKKKGEKRKASSS